MKLQNMTVIFIIIMIPIIIVVSYYIGLQINTIKMQKDYDVKLQTATQDSIQALEINTVEWNSASSNLADSKRRDVLAAINTFTTSLANSMGIGGAAKGRVQTYIPAIAYTMYDGYYIYSASPMREQQKDEKGLTIFEAGGNIQYSSNDPTYQYVLKPYSPYSARYVKTENNINIDVTVNYTLDNYIRVYGTVNGEYQTKEGYLVVCATSNSGADANIGVYINQSGNNISDIKYRGAKIVPETLKEQVYYIDAEGNNHVEEYPYIYDQYDNKLYYDEDEDNYFSINKNNQKVYLQNALPVTDSGFAIYNRFRKISIPRKDSDDWYVLKIFQILNPGGDNKFYYQDENGVYKNFSIINHKIGGIEVEDDLRNSKIKDKDFSAINYCVESYVFTQWVKNNLSDITVGNMQVVTKNNNTKPLSSLTSDEQKYYEYNNVDSGTQIFSIDQNNNPDPENDTAYANSILAQHKKDVIINTIEKNLAQATAQAQEMNVNYEYRLPQLSYEEWEQALSNISIIAFMQGMPIGLKYYNNYAIATSTLNKEYLDPDEIYFSGTEDSYYHQRQCAKAIGRNYVGYRSIDYVAKSYEITDVSGNKKTEYYYPHDNNDNNDSELECYYCLVNRSTYYPDEVATWSYGSYANWTDSYYNALARERYMQLDDLEGRYETNIILNKEANKTYYKYGETIQYTITITNKSTSTETFNIEDTFDNIKIEDFINITSVSVNDSDTSPYEIDGKTIRIKNISVRNGEEVKIIISGTIKTNNVGVFSNTAKVNINDKEFESKTSVYVIKDVKITAKSIIKPANVVFIIDASGSMIDKKRIPVENAVKDFVDKMDINSESLIGFSRFRKKFTIYPVDATEKGNSPYEIANKEEFKKDFTWFWMAGWTNFKDGLRVGIEVMSTMKGKKPNNKNIAIFLSDGSDTNGGYTEFATNLKEITDEVFSIKYGKFDTNETSLKEIASKAENYYNSEDMEDIFNKIFETTSININEQIEGSTLISRTDLIGTSEEATEGDWWMSLKNDSEFDFSINDVNNDEVVNTKITIKQGDIEIGTKTLAEWSRDGYIGKANGCIYLNLSKFEANSSIIVEIVQ